MEVKALTYFFTTKVIYDYKENFHMSKINKFKSFRKYNWNLKKKLNKIELN
jgi:hypothetical protein